MESLLVLDASACDARRHDVRRHDLRIVQEASPRVLLVSGTADGVHALEALPGVWAVTAPPDGIAEKLAALDLSPTETLFVRAWLRRRAEAPRRRKGTGELWDAPGFDAP